MRAASARVEALRHILLWINDPGRILRPGKTLAAGIIAATEAIHAVLFPLAFQKGFFLQERCMSFSNSTSGS
jgi:hypothetical protein